MKRPDRNEKTHHAVFVDVSSFIHKSPLLIKWQGSKILILSDPKIRTKSGVNAWKIK